QPIEHFARVNHDGVAHFEARAMPAARNQVSPADNFLVIGGIKQEGIRFNGFVRQSAAAGFFPRQALVENRDLKTGTGQPLAAERTDGTAPDNEIFLHLAGRFSGTTAAMTQAASIALNKAAAVAEPVR